jgi:hypothetical protein
MTAMYSTILTVLDIWKLILTVGNMVQYGCNLRYEILIVKL